MNMTYALRITLAALILGALGPGGLTRAAAATVRSIVLVHGANTDGSGWRGVYDLLTKDGYHVSVVQQPLTGLADDVAATQRIIDLEDGPVVLVGHSYGGTIITVGRRGTRESASPFFRISAQWPNGVDRPADTLRNLSGDVTYARWRLR